MLGSLREKVIFLAQKRKIKRMFRKSLGYDGDFENPKTYQEKVQFRKLYGNHHFYAMVADKYRVRDYVTEKAGAQYLIPLLGAYDRLNASVFESLPKAFIIKANHGCKWNRVVNDKDAMDVRQLIRYFNKQRTKRWGKVAGERHYDFIKPKIVIEQLLQSAQGGLPWDYSFFCYNGPRGFECNFAICSPQGKAAAFDMNWTLMQSNIPEEELAPHVRPTNFDEMVAVARRLSADFDFVRVDLYNIEGKIYFGEITCTPHQGFGIIKDEKRQKMRSEMWQLDAMNPLLYHAPKAYRDPKGYRREPVAVSASLQQV